MRSNENQNKNQYLDKFWDLFFTDQFKAALEEAQKLESESKTEEELDLALEFQAKVLLKQGQFKLAHQTLSNTKKDSSFRQFVDFVINGDPRKLLRSVHEDPDLDSNLYKAQVLLLSNIYWGEEYLNAIEAKGDSYELINRVFNKLLDLHDYDRAILASLQSLELVLEDQLLSRDLHLPIIHEQLENLIALSPKARYDSTKAKLYLLKARIFKLRDSAEDAEILFGKEGNTNGLGEVYLSYAKDFGETDYYQKALEQFMRSGNLTGQGMIYEAIASQALIGGEIKEAQKAFDKAHEKLSNGGIFEKLSLDIQKISLLAITGKYQKVKEAIHSLIKPQVPSFFIAQAYQILANTIIQLGEDVDLAKGYIETACDIFKQLKRYNQLLYSQNIYFQILLLQNDLDLINKTGQEIIQLATRLGNEEIKATKYLDLAFVTIRVSLEEGILNEKKISEATEFFKKAISLYQEQDNLIGEADCYQAMGNMYTGIGKLEEALNCFLTAKKLYNGEKAYLQSAITDTLIGILMLNYVILNKQTYPIAQRHFEQALLYFSKENLLDLNWKAIYYLADLNHKYYLTNKDKEEFEVYKNKAEKYYMEMLIAVEEFEEDSQVFSQHENLVGITIQEAFNKAYQFFITFFDEKKARKFKRHLN
jgi:hypothetical protein